MLKLCRNTFKLCTKTLQAPEHPEASAPTEMFICRVWFDELRVIDTAIWATSRLPMSLRYSPSPQEAKTLSNKKNNKKAIVFDSQVE